MHPEQREDLEDHRIDDPHAAHGDDCRVEPVLGFHAGNGAGAENDSLGRELRMHLTQFLRIDDRFVPFDPPMVAARADHMDRLDGVDEERPLELGAVRRARERSRQRRTGRSADREQRQPRRLMREQLTELRDRDARFDMEEEPPASIHGAVGGRRIESGLR